MLVSSPALCPHTLTCRAQWATGQDQVAKIKHGLHVCLKELKVFLDIDDVRGALPLSAY